MLRYLLEKEFKQIRRNSFLPKMILLFPCMIMLLMPWATNLDIKNINVSIVDYDHSTYSNQLIHKIESSTYFRLTNISENTTEALKSVERGESDLILEIQSDFEKDLVQQGVAHVMISANSVNGSKGGLGSAYLSGIINDFANDIRGKWIQTSGKSTLPQIQITSQNRFNPHLDYKLYFIPALMVILITLLCGFLPTFNIVSEKEIGTIEQINVTPVNKSVFILAKLIPYWIIGFIVLTISFGLAALIYRVIPAGSFLTIYIAASVYILAVSGMGLIISNNSATMQQALFVIFFFILILILLSGLFTPINSMPGWAQTITYANPLRYFISIMRSVYLRGSSLLEILPEVMALACFAVFFNAWAILSYKKKN